MPLTVEELVNELQKYPPDATVYAYEGEITGVVITKDGEMLGYILASDPGTQLSHDLKQSS